MIKTLNVALGQIGVAQLDPPGIGVPTLAPGHVTATGYYTDPLTGTQYYYNAYLDQWYYYAAGYIYPLAEHSWLPSPSPKIDLAAGDILRFQLSFYFMGPKSMDQAFEAAIGENKTEGSFNEWGVVGGTDWHAKKTLTIPASDTPKLHTEYYIDVVIPDSWPRHEGEDGAAYCKKDQFAWEEGKDGTPLYYDVCHIIPAKGEFTEMTISKFEKVE